ncbi:hypothetical protein AGR2A_Lc40018 [Agrobacterium genomosp. 2 str. CFBP 5494]|uniref:Uncharacterized protein n=1 Tax=Agrobacterium genomosp. 2 str. CFBP 5494 TaxID=1183436 RepID=A0A9W5B4B4_9HYPH|nr:hypothetical protein AGR2A_Lc40018 [Agrobacterium genomosp. 2 str. CFBP 5494]
MPRRAETRKSWARSRLPSWRCREAGKADLRHRLRREKISLLPSQLPELIGQPAYAFFDRTPEGCASASHINAEGEHEGFGRCITIRNQPLVVPMLPALLQYVGKLVERIRSSIVVVHNVRTQLLNRGYQCSYDHMPRLRTSRGFNTTVN